MTRSSGFVERRQSMRYPPAADTAVILEAMGNQKLMLAVKPADIGDRGMGFDHDTAFKPAMPCRFLFRTRDGRYLRHAADVLRCTPAGNGRHRIAVRFREPLDLAAVLGAPCMTSPVAASASGR